MPSPLSRHRISKVVSALVAFACVVLTLVVPASATGASPRSLAVSRSTTNGLPSQSPATVAPPTPSITVPPTTVAPPLARSAIVVDANTGQVLESYNDRQPLRVASVAKILTALVVRATVPLGAPVPISAHAAGVPALKINVKAGQVWNSTDLLWSMLLPSANDAAVALAERAGGGNLPGFVVEVDREATKLGLADHPALRDPAGLDGAYSFDGGNYLSARDLAIATRAFLVDPVLAGIVDQRVYRFHGGDGADHRIVGHNAFLTTYPGAIGVKTGYTAASGHCLVAAARRDGRTLIAVVLDSPGPDAVAAKLLDSAFAGPLAAGTGDRLPPRPGDVHPAARPKPTRAGRQVVLAATMHGLATPGRDWLTPLLAAAALCLALAFLVRRSAVLHRRGIRRLAGPSRGRHPSSSRGRSVRSAPRG